MAPKVHSITVIFPGFNGGAPEELPLRDNETVAQVAKNLNIPLADGKYSIKITPQGQDGEMSEGRVNTRLNNGDLVSVTKTSHKSGV